MRYRAYYKSLYAIVKEQYYFRIEVRGPGCEVLSSCLVPRSSCPNLGGGERVRTDDPLRARQVLSQLSYTPKDNMVGLDGLEPSTSRLSVVCSSQLSYRPLFGFDFVRLAALASSSARQRSCRYASSPQSLPPCQPDKSEPSRYMASILNRPRVRSHR